MAGINWVQYTKRTEDPKLAYLEHALTERGIPHRRHGRSWHGPILQVPEQHLDAAWALLSEKLPRRRVHIDVMPDDHEFFHGYEPFDDLGEDGGAEQQDEMTGLTRAALNRGRP